MAAVTTLSGSRNSSFCKCRAFNTGKTRELALKSTYLPLIHFFFSHSEYSVYLYIQKYSVFLNIQSTIYRVFLNIQIYRYLYLYWQFSYQLPAVFLVTYSFNRCSVSIEYCPSFSRSHVSDIRLLSVPQNKYRGFKISSKPPSHSVLISLLGTPAQDQNNENPECLQTKETQNQTLLNEKARRNFDLKGYMRTNPIHMWKTHTQAKHLSNSL